MSTISILPDAANAVGNGFRAVAGHEHSVGPTVGQALDALTAKIGPPSATTLVVVQPQVADEFFTQAQRSRLTELMNRWREARDGGKSLAAHEQSELDALSVLEVRAAGERAAKLLQELTS